MLLREAGKEQLLENGAAAASGEQLLPSRQGDECCVPARAQGCDRWARRAHLLPTAPVAGPTELSLSSVGQNTEVSLNLQFSTEAKHSPDGSLSSSGDKVSLQSVSSRGRASTAAGKRKTDSHTSQSQKQHLMDPAGSQVKYDPCWLMPGTFLLPLRSKGAAYSRGSTSPRA